MISRQAQFNDMLLLLLQLMGNDGIAGRVGPAAVIYLAAFICTAACIAGDNLQDLKCGHVVGSTPWKQQVMQILGVVVAALAMAPILNLLNDAYGIGSKGLPAPQANLMGTVGLPRHRFARPRRIEVYPRSHTATPQSGAI